MRLPRPLAVIAHCCPIMLMAGQTASAACMSSERGPAIANQYVALAGQDPNASAAIGDAANMWNACPQTSAGGIPTVWAGFNAPSAATIFNGI